MALRTERLALTRIIDLRYVRKLKMSWRTTQ